MCRAQGPFEYLRALPLPGGQGKGYVTLAHLLHIDYNVRHNPRQLQDFNLPPWIKTCPTPVVAHSCISPRRTYASLLFLHEHKRPARSEGKRPQTCTVQAKRSNPKNEPSRTPCAHKQSPAVRWPSPQPRSW